MMKNDYLQSTEIVGGANFVETLMKVNVEIVAVGQILGFCSIINALAHPIIHRDSQR